MGWFGRKAKKEVDVNPYIKLHNIKSQNDIWFENYLLWCKVNNETPIDKAEFIKAVSNNEIETLLK